MRIFQNGRKAIIYRLKKSQSQEPDTFTNGQIWNFPVELLTPGLEELRGLFTPLNWNLLWMYLTGGPRSHPYSQLPGGKAKFSRTILLIILTLQKSKENVLKMLDTLIWQRPASGLFRKLIFRCLLFSFCTLFLQEHTILTCSDSMNDLCNLI